MLGSDILIDKGLFMHVMVLALSSYNLVYQQAWIMPLSLCTCSLRVKIRGACHTHSEFMHSCHA